jgi:hypothetical protein
VITFWNQRDTAVFGPHYGVDRESCTVQRRPNISIDPLHRIAVRLIEFVKIYFLQISLYEGSLVINPMDIVFVWWIRAPIPAWRIDLYEDKSMNRRPGW